MKLSVILLTFNHDKFIEQAVRSVMAQQTTFDYEVLIAEDHSTDDTGMIVRSLESEFAGTVRVLHRPGNLGMQANFMDAYRQCRGQYVAYLDGDDYWVDTNKLQLQVNHLDRHPTHSFCFYNVWMEEEGRTGQRTPLGATTPELRGRDTFTLEDLLVTNFVPSCSIVARNGLIQKFPEWVQQMHGIDWIFNLLNARHGPVGFIPGCLGVYRKHQAGVWSSCSEAEQWQTIKEIYTLIQREMPGTTWPLIETRLTLLELYAGMRWYQETVTRLMQAPQGDAEERPSAALTLPGAVGPPDGLHWLDVVWRKTKPLAKQLLPYWVRHSLRRLAWWCATA